MKPLRCVLLACALATVAQAQTSDAPTQLFKQNDPVLTEVSGVAVVRSAPELLWMHNDSGDSPRLFAVNRSGKIALTLNLQGASARDWEDMAAQNGWVYVGDIGDNVGIRPDLQIYRFRAPKVNARATGVELTLKPTQWQKMTLRFPDGARDCESLAVTRDGRLLLISKEESGVSGFYVYDAPFKNGAGATLRKIGVYKFGATGLFTKLATAADLSSDGRKLVVSTYTDVYEFPLARASDFNTLVLRPQEQALPVQRQAEAVCYSLDGRTIYSTGEKDAAPVWALKSKLK